MPDLLIEGFTVRSDRAYDLDHHMWVEVISEDRVRVGMDPLGLETAGTLAQLQFMAPGETLRVGEAFGSLESEKFVGPLVSPVSGTVVAVNGTAMADPGLVERDPYDAGWMVEISPDALDADRDALARGADAIAERFTARVAEYRRDGVLAE